MPAKKAKAKGGPKVPLLDDDDWLSPPLLTMLNAVFARFDIDADGALSESELQAFARACNDGTALDADELDQIRQYFDTDSSGRLTLKGFHEMYHMQTSSRCAPSLAVPTRVTLSASSHPCARARCARRPEDTWKDARALGYNNQLEPVEQQAQPSSAASAAAAAAPSAAPPADAAASPAASPAAAAAAAAASGGEAGMKEALRAALAAVAAAPNDPAAHRRCGEALLALGRGEAAARSMAKAGALEHLQQQPTSGAPSQKPTDDAVVAS